MPNDLESAFAALSDDAAHARLAPAAVLRRRSDRRVVTRSLAGVAAAAVLVAGVAVGTRMVLADDATPPSPPAQSTAPTTPPPASPTPSSSPSATSADPTGNSPSSPPPSRPPAMPTAIPSLALLGRSDANVVSLKRAGTAHEPPGFCPDASYPSESRAGVRATEEIIYRNPGDGPDHTPSGEVADTVTVYRGDGAEQFMDEFRAAVRDCPQGKRGNPTFAYKSLGSLGAGDESVLVQGSTPARGDDGEPEADGSTYRIYFAAVRIGDSVALVENGGYESVSAERKVAEGFARKAAQRLASWRD